MELSEYGITYSPKTIIKLQVLEDLHMELSAPIPKKESEQWVLSVNKSSNLKGSGVGIVLEGPREFVLEQSLYLSFQSSNNQAEY